MKTKKSRSFLPTARFRSWQSSPHHEKNERKRLAWPMKLVLSYATSWCSGRRGREGERVFQFLHEKVIFVCDHADMRRHGC